MAYPHTRTQIPETKLKVEKNQNRELTTTKKIVDNVMLMQTFKKIRFKKNGRQTRTRCKNKIYNNKSEKEQHQEEDDDSKRRNTTNSKIKANKWRIRVAFGRTVATIHANGRVVCARVIIKILKTAMRSGKRGKGRRWGWWWDLAFIHQTPHTHEKLDSNTMIYTRRADEILVVDGFNELKENFVFHHELHMILILKTNATP